MRVSRLAKDGSENVLIDMNSYFGLRILKAENGGCDEQKNCKAG